MFITFISEYWLTILLSIFMYLLGLFSIYIKQRTTNLALRKDNKRLTEETEEIKKRYELDITKRKYQYESKRDQYFKYFNLLDSFTSISSNEIILELPQKIAKFNEDLINSEGDKQKEAKAISEYTEYINSIMFKSNENLLKVKQETNGIKLIANDKVRSLLTEIETNYEHSMKISSELISAIAQLIFLKKSDTIDNLKEELSVYGNKAIGLHDQLVEEVRKELSEI